MNTAAEDSGQGRRRRAAGGRVGDRALGWREEDPVAPAVSIGAWMAAAAGRDGRGWRGGQTVGVGLGDGGKRGYRRWQRERVKTEWGHEKDK